MNPSLRHENHEFDVCVVGGGMAGLCAAIASARQGVRTAIVQDRPVFGGNASSEVRMWICGAAGEYNKEAGVLEEIQLDNQYYNPAGNFSIWDSVLYGKAKHQPNLDLFLNASCADAEMDGNRIAAVQAWQLTSQTWHTIRARTFVDCSGDSVLAPLTGAEFRTGREARDEFDEHIQPETADRKTMGNTLLIQARETDSPQPFTAPPWAYTFDSPADLAHRGCGVEGTNFWWLEVGGLLDTIHDAEAIRDELMKIAYGVWDYIKNRAPAREQMEHWALEWVGSLPGKRENRRYVGEHILTQNEVRAGGPFDDIIAYGGWSMDDHHPAGIFYPGKPTIFHPAPSPYGIPYRSLYSCNVANLLFAGRNISVTHAALSSTRVMATCSLLGQAAGTAAALTVQHACDPASLSSGAGLTELQAVLMDADAWLPGRTRPVSDLAMSANPSGDGQHPERLRDGTDRDLPDGEHAWEGTPGQAVEFHWDTPCEIAGLRLVFDTLKQDKRMPCKYPKHATCAVPTSLVKAFRVEQLDAAGSWQTVQHVTDNHQRIVRLPLAVQTTGLRLVAEATWGDDTARILAADPLSTLDLSNLPAPERPRFAAARASVAPEDLAPPGT